MEVYRQKIKQKRHQSISNLPRKKIKYKFKLLLKEFCLHVAQKHCNWIMFSIYRLRHIIGASHIYETTKSL